MTTNNNTLFNNNKLGKGTYEVKVINTNSELMNREEKRNAIKRVTKFSKEVKIPVNNSEHLTKTCKVVKGDNNVLISRTFYGK